MNENDIFAHSAKYWIGRKSDFFYWNLHLKGKCRRSIWKEEGTLYAILLMSMGGEPIY